MRVEWRLVLAAATLLASSCRSSGTESPDAGGCTTPSLLPTGTDSPSWFAMDSSHAYWSASNSISNTATIRALDLCNGSTRTLFSGSALPSKMEARDGILYFADSLTTGSITAIKTSDASAVRLSPQQSSVVDMTTDAAAIYWLDGGALRTVPRAGGTAVDLASNLNAPAGLAVDNGLLFWVDRGTEFVSGDVESMPTSGPPLQQLAGGQTFVGGHVGALAVDAGHLYFGGWAGEIFALPRGGGAAVKLVGSQSASVLAVANGSVYWINVTAQPDAPIRGLWRVPLAGGSPEQLDPSAIGNSLFLQSGSIYYLVPQGIAGVPM